MAFEVWFGFGDSCAVCRKAILDEHKDAFRLADVRRRRDESSYIDFHGDCWKKVVGDGGVPGIVTRAWRKHEAQLVADHKAEITKEQASG